MESRISHHALSVGSLCGVSPGLSSEHPCISHDWITTNPAFFIVLVLNRQMVEHPQVLKKEKYETSQTAKYAKFSPVFFEQANLYFLANIFKSFLSLLALEKQFP